MALVTELCDDLVFAGGGLEGADFLDGMGQWLFAVNVFAAAHGFEGDHGVGVIGRADHHGVESRAHLVEHDPIILEPPGLGILLKLFGGVIVVDVAEGDDVVAFGGHGIDVRAALAADADARHVDTGVGRRAFAGAQYSGGEEMEQGGTGAGAMEELSAVYFDVFHRMRVCAAGASA
jgi:hypothetical protein